ncbi:histidine kinase [Actinoplanes sp. NBRC 103695]|uniref:sensor histidine kinase n=1 Tax=Actinoplanes sp. NBRC 103695 TaxID=3032202 RepID=UPI0024A49614|nr:histidine kinase [Actinoplanes sp. NBRC 103695]GLY94097.1 two-component sensor histidine kinase [Actinoplanes sp. NBRC 103695]
MALWTTRLPRAWPAAVRHPQVADALLGVLVGVSSLVSVLMGPRAIPGRSLTSLDVLVAAMAALLITLRRRWPVLTLAVVTVAAAWAVAGRGEIYVLTAVSVISAYTVASRRRRTTAWIAGAAAALVVYLAAVVFAGQMWDSSEALEDLGWMGMAIAIGDAVRTRRAYVAAVEERAVRAEQTREEEARRRVAEERLRIARELHDIVAHHIALINVQTEVASHVLRQEPDQAEEALSHVRQSVRTVLDELSIVLTVLRRADDPEPSTEPTPGLERLGGLLDSVAAAGLRVEHQQEGEARSLPSAVDLAAYRIVQESLTNARKHGRDPNAQVRLTYTPDGLVITVENRAGPSPTGTRTGHGLTGMRERAASVGGTLAAGPDASGRFAVRAVLPAPVSQEVSK